MIVTSLIRKNEIKLTKLQDILVKKVNEIEKLRKKNKSLEEMSQVYLLKIVELEKENAILKGQIDILNRFSQ